MPNEHAPPPRGGHGAPGGEHQAPHGEGHPGENPHDPGHGDHEIPIHGGDPVLGHPEHPELPGGPEAPGFEIPVAEQIDFNVFDPPDVIRAPGRLDEGLLGRLESLPPEIQRQVLENVDTDALFAVFKTERFPVSHDILLREARDSKLIHLTGRRVTLHEGVLKDVKGVVLANAVGHAEIEAMVRRRQLVRERDILEARTDLVAGAGDDVLDLWLDRLTAKLASGEAFTPEEQLQMIVRNASEDVAYPGLPGFPAAPQLVVKELLAAGRLVWTSDGRNVTAEEIPIPDGRNLAIFLLAKMALREIGRVPTPPDL